METSGRNREKSVKEFLKESFSKCLDKSRPKKETGTGEILEENPQYMFEGCLTNFLKKKKSLEKLLEKLMDIFFEELLIQFLKGFVHKNV